MQLLGRDYKDFEMPRKSLLNHYNVICRDFKIDVFNFK